MSTSSSTTRRMSFARYFRLKDPARTTLMLSPEHDSQLFVDLKGASGGLRRAFQGVPQVVVEGDFGTGKSHALHFARSLAQAESDKYDTIFLTLSGFNNRTDFIAGIHRPLIGPLLDIVLADQKYAAEMMGVPVDTKVEPVQRALRDLLSPEATRVTAARAWLSASRTLTPSKALKAGYSMLLDEAMKPADLAMLYVSLARRWRSLTNRTLLLFLDEGESFSRLGNEDAQASLGAGLRQLLDATNDSLGIFIGLNTPQTRKGTHPMLRSDVRSRVRQSIVLPTLQDTALREQFIEGLWEKLAADRENPPFMLEREARHFVVHEIDAIRRQSLGDLQQASPTPRDMLLVLDLIARTAYFEQAPLPLSESTLRRWMGIPRQSVSAG